MFKWIFGVVGFVVGFVAPALLAAELAVRYRFDVFHTYIVAPTPPPGGWRTPFDVPTSTWPMLVILAIAILSSRFGVALGKTTDRRLRSEARQ